MSAPLSQPSPPVLPDDAVRQHCRTSCDGRPSAWCRDIPGRTLHLACGLNAYTECLVGKPDLVAVVIVTKWCVVPEPAA